THFALEIVPLEPEDHARLLETVGGREHIRLTGNTYSLKLGVRGEDGNWTTITAFGQPVTLVFLVDPAMDPALTHVYCVDEQGRLQYVPSVRSGDTLIAEVDHFSRY